MSEYVNPEPLAQMLLGRPLYEATLDADPEVLASITATLPNQADWVAVRASDRDGRPATYRLFTTHRPAGYTVERLSADAGQQALKTWLAYRRLSEVRVSGWLEHLLATTTSHEEVA